MTKLTD